MSSNIEHIDLLGLLKYFKGKGLEHSKVFGQITRQLDYPSVLQKGVELSETGIFVEMSVFAVDLKYYEGSLRQLGIHNKDGIYMANGSIVAYIEKHEITGVDWYTLEGTLRLSSKDASSNVVSVFNFYKTDKGKWGLRPSYVMDLDISAWDRHSSCYAWINESSRVGCVKQPNFVKELPQFNSVKVDSLQPINQNVKPTEPCATIPKCNPAGRPFIRENRDVVKEPNEMLEEFKSILDKSKSVRYNYIKSLKSDYNDSFVNKYVQYMTEGLLRNLKSKPSPVAMTGRMILGKYLSNFKGADDEYIGKTTAKDYLINIFDEVACYILDHDCTVSAEGKAWEVCRLAFGQQDLFYAGVVGIILGIPFETMYEMTNNASKNGLSIIKILNENPYLIQFISQMKFDDIEHIALCFNKHNDKSLSRHRNIAMLNAFITSTDDGSTTFTKDALARENIGVRLTGSKYNKMCANGTYLSPSTLINIKCYVKNVADRDLGYSQSNFVKQGIYYIRKLRTDEILTAINDYCDSGLGLNVNNYITSFGLADKEIFVFESMYKLGKRVFDYDSDLIEQYIHEYETKVGFKLEERQNMAVHLLVNAGFIVAGSAGSGKTTVSNCVVYVLSKLEPFMDIQFAAPTAKAAKRMQEVVHKEVSTLHSKFKLGVSNENVLSEDELSSDFSRVAFFFDEGAMITIDLLYKVLKRIDIETSRVFLFGDFNQLPPIGKGLPFKNLLRFMPCVFLNVSKRAAEGSMITANSNYVNEYSEPSNWQKLESKDDFFLMPCKGNQIGRVIYDLCAYYLGKKQASDISYITDFLGIQELPKVSNLTPDDIQVVSPLAKEAYSWGTIQLNKLLQPLFNQTRNVNKTFVYQLTQNIAGNKFVIGDRVIHVDKNMYSMQWYSTYKDGCFQKIYGQGICNGEVGKVVDFVLANDCTFYDEVEDKPDEFEYMGCLRDDSSWGGELAWFVVVEYYDYISERNFYILYRAEENTQVINNEGTIFKGEDLSKLNLFYAGTTHKLQGSQSKIVICALDSVSYRGFITRQMIYTMFTRGEKLVFGVGSVGNESSSMLSRARCDIAASDTLTIGELLV